ncbi:deoxyribodipyrimidine photo-lyase isoform A [Chlorella sorokiniana]|uniref:Deoxyribodipyrimidine photo-lyase isoform A n=1 Tax=Chlorella sorokiniana TaxID=3076 RepID=A0A2P6TSQ8_CHLSO|nr:deoxyribodipyrimidine photo-lyase isoform B [Chlorella sorokiniana]PRW57100.1 deoxyribodipyrimidine photo-lyase isoform A [Chlorella sorokiniana]|eukprot:PRW57099.1 deoxyribodipyrimidine photo-lyase isoform B [Chlorella sorokiniana]
MLWNIWRPLLIILGIVFTCDLISLFVDLNANKEEEEFVIRSFSMCSFVLSLLLSVRVNIAYNRWWTLRSGYGSAVYGVADLVRRATSCVPDMSQVLELQRWGAVWANCIYAFIGWQPALPPAIDQLLAPEEAQALRAAAKQRHYALQRLRMLVLQASSSLSTSQAVTLDDAMTKAQAGAGACGAIRCTATPLVLRYTCTGLILLWLAIVALIRIGYPNWLSLPMTLLLGLCMLCVDELASQMENAPHLVSLEALLVDAMEDAANSVAEAEQHRAAVWGWRTKGGLSGPEAYQGAAAVARAGSGAVQLGPPGLCNGDENC